MPSVLLVDDSPLTRRVLTRRLLEAGFDVRAEATLAAARDADPSAFTCAVLDLELPDGFGCDLADALRRRHPRIRLAFFTAGAPEDALARARAHGPVFHKPQVDAVVAWVTARHPPPTK
jgi:CheY-like chemotaxis protein